MKFWKRIFIYSMIWFIIIFNGAGILIIENMHKRNLDRTIKIFLDEYENLNGIFTLSDDFISYWDSKKETNQEILKNWIDIVIKSYFSSDVLEPRYLEMYSEDNKLIFSNSKLKLDISRPEITGAKVNEKIFIVRKVKNRHYIFISSKLNIHRNNIKLVLIKDVELNTYKERYKNYKLFLLLDCFIFLIFGLGMYLISKKLTNPIVRFSKVSQEIAKGNYKKRINIDSRNDEIGLLAYNFNVMVQAVDTNIEELKKMNNDKQEFIDSLTHELKTPLTAIIGYSDLLIKGNINENIKFKALNYINSEAKRLEKLSFTLLKLIVIKQEGLTFENFSLKQCVGDACKTLSYKIENKNIVLKVDVESVVINGDKQLITILLINFLDNAIKASKDFGVISIKGFLEKNNNKYILIFKDCGVGIPREDLDKIKKPFYMVDKARDRAKNGVGLGLAICEEICQVHNIEFDIDSKINKGTEIILKFHEENNL